MMDEENPVSPVATRAWADAVRAWASVGKALIEKFSIGRLYDPIHARRMNKVKCKNYLQNVKTNLEVAQIKAQAKAVNEQVNKHSCADGRINVNRQCKAGGNRSRLDKFGV